MRKRKKYKTEDEEYHALYDIYKEQLNKTYEQNKKYGIEKPVVPSEGMFIMNLQNKKKKDKNRMSYERLAKDIARDAVYEASTKQAKAWAKAAQRLGIDYKYSEIRVHGMPEDLENAIKKEYQLLKKSGMSIEGIKLKIAEIYFSE